ncbi:MAG TPA: DNA translocase FtsK [Clostridia bacterium]|nr:DNA translocase FtsK [Clostridia bacterium]
MVPKEETKRELKTDLTGLGMVTFALLTLISLVVTKMNSQYFSEEAIGAAGRFLVRCMLGLWGQGRFVFAILIGFWGIKMMQKLPQNKMKQLIAGTSIFFLIFLTLLHLPIVRDSVGFTELMSESLLGEGGGLIGAFIAYVLFFFFGRVGSYVVLAAAALVSLILLGNFSFSSALQSVRNKMVSFFAVSKQKLTDFLFYEVEVDDEEEEAAEKEKSKQQPVIIDHVQDTNPPQEDIAEEEEVFEPEPEITAGESGRFQLPSLDLLQKPLQLKKSRIDKNITDRVKLLEQTLASFGIDIKVTQVSCGPAITRYELQPAKGVKVSRIVSLADDIALSLAAPDVRIEAPIPGKAALGIEVPNKEISLVYFRDVLESKEFSGSKESLVVALGKDIAGTTVVANLRDMPHLLVAGATGSGKSVCMNTLIASLLFRNTPDEMKLMLIDPKMVELTDYNGIPHLICPVVTEPKRAATALRWMVREMEKRYEDFAKNGVRDIQRFNELASTRDDLDRLPFIIVLIDELADLMMVAPTDVEDCICRLAQMARAAGIHLVVATQRPSVDVITGLIKANIPSRIAFATSSQTDSRTILDTGGAEKLLGKGDMLFHPVGASKPIRIQGAFISDREVESLVRFLKSQAAPVYEEDLLGPMKDTPEEEEELEDELLPKALNLCIEQGHASISLLQRRLHIGYTRAARLIDIMERKGYVGPYEGSKPRAILSGWEDYRKEGEND